MRDEDAESHYAFQREAMVREQIENRGIRHVALLAALRSVPRHRFVPPSARARAYADSPLEIGYGQTVSQPYIVALMLESILSGPLHRVLEIGTGSGYQTAILALLADEVYTLERIEALAACAADVLRDIGCTNVRWQVGDGSAGWPSAAPFDAIVVSAAGPRVPRPLMEQLSESGRLVMPVGDRYAQELFLIERTAGRWSERALGGCVFVPLIGSEGWPE